MIGEQSILSARKDSMEGGIAQAGIFCGMLRGLVRAALNYFPAGSITLPP